MMVALCALQQQAPLHRRMARRTKSRVFAPTAARLHELRQNTLRNGPAGGDFYRAAK
jgi:hypothetical protein